VGGVSRLVVHQNSSRKPKKNRVSHEERSDRQELEKAVVCCRGWTALVLQSQRRHKSTRLHFIQGLHLCRPMQVTLVLLLFSSSTPNNTLIVTSYFLQPRTVEERRRRQATTRFVSRHARESLSVSSRDGRG